MLNDGTIEPVIEGFYLAESTAQYNKDVGLLADNRWLEETYII